LIDNRERVDIYAVAAKMAVELNSLYMGKQVCRRKLLEFMAVNEWFGIKRIMKYGVILITEHDVEKLEKPLTLWLSAYKKPGREKINLMLLHFSEVYPITCHLYHEFVVKRAVLDEPSAWKLLDYLLSEIDKEITDYDEAELKEFANKMDTQATIQCARLFADFLHTTKYNGNFLTKWRYAFGTRDTSELVNDAYPIKDFAIMAYCVFNEEMWIKQGLVEKALQSSKDADLWLFVSLHFICALRATDMARIPAPTLPYDSDTVLKKISENTFGKSEASVIVEELIIRLKLKPMKPSKTSAYENVAEFKLFVPESLRTPLGIIMAIALAHHPEILPGKPFVPVKIDTRSIRGFFGDHFIKALGNKRFTTRRCNKSYLQGIDSSASMNNEPSKPKGYILAALARGHKGGIGRLAETTDIYLRDANFTGYTPEFIIREMFERGIFSFIPAILLEIYTGKEYKMLSVSSQTKLIGELGLAAHQIEWVVSAVENAFVKSKNTVKSMLQNSVKENVGDILQNIASGNAPGRQDECLCLMTAAKISCPYPDRNSCIGCGYEIYTKTTMHTLMSEYIRLMALKNSAKNTDSWRQGKILEQAILPAISEMLEAVKLLYHDTDVTEILDIVERGLDYANGSL
jgi:hypothetical protein